ncbi:MAG: hypothetical protein JSV79_03485, partial [Armatimonadota bacterium]
MLQSLLLDNPVLVKHVRARLRRQHLLPFVAMVIMVCGAIVWSAAVNAGISSDEVTGMLVLVVVLKAIILLLVGTSRVAASVGEARSSGMLDFHRISPQRPAALTVGFLLGGPIREYILFACTLPFSLFLGLIAGLGPLRWLAIVLAILAAALLYHAAALVAALTLPDFRGGGASIVVLLVILHMAFGPAMFGGLPLAYLTIIPTTAAAIDPTGPHTFVDVSFLGQLLSVLLFSLLHQGLLLVFLLIAAARKMRDELAPPYAKPMAVLFYLLIAALTVLDVALDSPPGSYSHTSGLGPSAAIY